MLTFQHRQSFRVTLFYYPGTQTTQTTSPLLTNCRSHETGNEGRCGKSGAPVKRLISPHGLPGVGSGATCGVGCTAASQIQIHGKDLSNNQKGKPGSHARGHEQEAKDGHQSGRHINSSLFTFSARGLERWLTTKADQIRRGRVRAGPWEIGI